MSEREFRGWRTAPDVRNPPSLAARLSMGTRVWYHNTAQVAAEEQP